MGVAGGEQGGGKDGSSGRVEGGELSSSPCPLLRGRRPPHELERVALPSFPSTSLALARARRAMASHPARCGSSFDGSLLVTRRDARPDPPTFTTCLQHPLRRRALSSFDLVRRTTTASHRARRGLLFQCRTRWHTSRVLSNGVERSEDGWRCAWRKRMRTSVLRVARKSLVSTVAERAGQRVGDGELAVPSPSRTAPADRVRVVYGEPSGSDTHSFETKAR